MYSKIVNFSYKEGEFNTEDGMAEILNISEDEINYEVTESYVKDPKNYGKNIDELNNDELENKTNKFTLVKENNVWKVSEFTYPR